MSLVLVLIGQFCHDMISRQKVKVVVIGQLSLLLFSVHLLFVGNLFKVMYGYELFVRTAGSC